MATIQGVSGSQFTPGMGDAYTDAAYQYATSSYAAERPMNPGLIVEPSNFEDIKEVILYAKANKKAIAIRTGGHQYSGASSTGPDNIQLNLRNTFRAEDDLTYHEVGRKSFVRASVSHTLGEFNAFLGKNKVFVPHGQCVEVHLGGHAQTGGYGQLGRSFGLLGDHITSLEIVDHNGERKEITKGEDPELFFAWTGGSPGNMGVLTHITLEVHRDSDYVGSRGLRALHTYSTDKLKKLLQVLAEMNDDVNFPRNYDLCISVLSANADMRHWIGGVDDQMEEEHPEIFGKDGHIDWPRMIVVYAQWVPFSPDDKPDMAWFEKLHSDSWFIGGQKVEEKPMSELTAGWIFRNVREFDLPYVKRTYATKSTNLSKNGWVDWVVDRMDKVMEPLFNKQWLSAQLQVFGGVNSQFTRHAGNGTAYSWRDQTMCMTIDNFHEDSKKAEAEAWQAENDKGAFGPGAYFSDRDMRVLWGSWGNFDLDANWRAYYDDEEKYQRLREARKLADPDGVFTPNPFCVKRAD